MSIPGVTGADATAASAYQAGTMGYSTDDDRVFYCSNARWIHLIQTINDKRYRPTAACKQLRVITGVPIRRTTTIALPNQQAHQGKYHHRTGGLLCEAKAIPCGTSPVNCPTVCSPSILPDIHAESLAITGDHNKGTRKRTRRPK